MQNGDYNVLGLTYGEDEVWKTWPEFWDIEAFIYVDGPEHIVEEVITSFITVKLYRRTIITNLDN